MKTTVTVAVIILFVLALIFTRLPNNGQYRGYVYFIKEEATCTTVKYKTDLSSSSMSTSTLRKDDPILGELRDAQRNAQEVYIEYRNHPIGFCTDTVTNVEVIE